MAKFAREEKLRERRREKQARKDARKQATLDRARRGGAQDGPPLPAGE